MTTTVPRRRPVGPRVYVDVAGAVLVSTVLVGLVTVAATSAWTTGELLLVCLVATGTGTQLLICAMTGTGSRRAGAPPASADLAQGGNIMDLIHSFASSAWYVLLTAGGVLTGLAAADLGRRRARARVDELAEHGDVVINQLAALATSYGLPPAEVRQVAERWQPEAVTGQRPVVAGLVGFSPDPVGTRDRLDPARDRHQGPVTGVWPGPATPIALTGQVVDRRRLAPAARLTAGVLDEDGSGGSVTHITRRPITPAPHAGARAVGHA